MISWQHIVTYGTAQPRWLSNVADLALAPVDGKWMLFAVNATGGVSTYRISDPLSPLEQKGYSGDFLHGRSRAQLSTPVYCATVYRE